MKLIVGLGNPGKQYQSTRHNAGWIVLDILLERYGYNSVRQEFNSEIYTSLVGNEKVLFVKPLTFMNNSGIAIFQIMNYYKININDLIVIHDDKDLSISRLQFKKTGSAAGHNGIKSIIQHLSTQDFYRLRIGIDSPRDGWKIIDWVLSKFSDNDLLSIKNLVQQKSDFVIDFVENKSFLYIMNKYN
ncbi:aminoacyl-tRNA hydrolase [Mycoplasma putrefaciens]|uniref:Peptidyl-tRNA hydrolase n=1 Tax=Mycoplasma putrefaciens (strain ATCC 15718 / NCTC 10155 / C30 KS-1 / KS-1) TaxID=743965 RepID=A0A7U3ZS14_MYCPK|nr:aminoacyl-tRNA hydrolase [Mycoplasma putrefaciens]AEM68438.1 peptidyl-tRNA hydrolase [Mycoplasma putrefaciens KS1]